MTNNGGLLGTAIGVGFGIYALGALNRLNRDVQRSQNRLNKNYCPKCKRFSDKILCERCTRRHREFKLSNILVGR